jgi:hypothetical protein
MRFEARELKPDPEPVLPENLRKGEIYFAVLFLDDDGVIPTLEPRIFIGRDLEGGGESQLYFQEFDSYKRGVRFESAVGLVEAFYGTSSNSDSGASSRKGVEVPVLSRGTI